MEIFVVNVIINGEKYYLVDLKGTISKSKNDSMLFPNKNVAYCYATKVESIIENSLGKVESLVLSEFIQ